MKILLFFLLIFFGNAAELTVEPYSKTGHDQFAELEFENPDKMLLVEMTDYFIDLNLRELPKKFWGTSNKYYCKYENATYVGETVFSRSNKTSQQYVFNYSLSEVEYYERSININGSVNIDGKRKKDKVEISGKVNVNGGISIEESNRITESYDMKITVYPNKKITLRVAGEAKISSGFSKSYVFWICTKKGAWETVDVVTSYFELVEEDV
ncbi:MAG TPA: hypothetical protein GXZ48_08105 [Acholeplasmataceae bacterium]|nr:hypothetical protein [Acholeplasmataceae bacterium]